MDLRRIYEHLTHEGYRPSLDNEYTLTFKSEGKHYVLDRYQDDEHFIRLLAPSIWEIDSGEELAEAIFQANKASAETKCAKVFVIENQEKVWASLEMFVADEQAFNAIFFRCLHALNSAVIRFHEGMAAWRTADASPDDQGQPDTENPSADPHDDEPVLFKLFRNLCLRGDFDEETINAFMKVLESDQEGRATQVAREYLEQTKAEAMQALESENVDFLDIEFPDQSTFEDIEEAYFILWDKAQSASCVQGMAAVRLSMMAVLGQDRQSELIGLWT
jgi:hypothetical protein